VKLSEKISTAIEKMSPKKLVLLCAGAALVVFLILYLILSALFSPKEEGKAPQKTSVIPVIEAAKDIPSNTIITDDMIHAVEVSQNLVPSGALTDKRAVIGKKSGSVIYAGDVITARKLSKGPAGFVGMIPEGMRAVSFAVNDVTGVSGFAKPGDRVDIVLCTQREGKYRITTKVLLKDVLILAVNKTSTQAQKAPDKTKSDNGNKGPLNTPPTNSSNQSSNSSMGTPSVVTVALTPYDAAKLIGSTQIGQLQMLLRPSDDKDDHYVGYYVIPLPQPDEPRPAPAYTPPVSAGGPSVSINSGLTGIEVIRGTNSSRGH